MIARGMPGYSLPFAFLVSGCMTAATDRGDVAYRDSAGIAIVESRAPLWNEGAGWSVDSQPLLVIGDASGDSAYSFSDIRGLTRNADGGVIVADAGSRQLRLYDAGGRLQKVAGRRGNGPGEYRNLEIMRACEGDMIVVWDFARLLFFTRSLEFVRQNNLTAAPWPPVCFRDGGTLLQGSVPSDAERLARGTLYDSRVVLFATDSAGQRAAELDTITVWWRVAGEHEGSWGFVHPVAPITATASREDELVIGYSKSLEIRFVNRSGTSVRIHRSLAESFELTPDVVQAYKEATLDISGEQTRQAIEAFGWPMPGTRSAYSNVLVDGDGNAWLHRTEIHGRSTNRWTVFARDGSHLGDVRIPANLQVFEIGGNWLLGVSRDSLDVERVQLHQLRKPG
jgi:hypothetical protein